MPLDHLRLPGLPDRPACGLTGIVDEALAAFFAVLERYTLADLVAQRAAALLNISALAPPDPQIATVDVAIKPVVETR